MTRPPDRPEAPLRRDLAAMPEDGRAVWCTCGDGTRIRVATWAGMGDRTVLIFPGRTEFIEKYGEVVDRLLDRGFSVAAIDWRGQGMADRHPTRRSMGWVEDFAEYQADVAQMLGVVRDHGLPKPFGMIAHSMGGAIGLRALLEGLAVEKAVFSAPMWGILVAPHLRPVASLVSALGPPLGLGERLVPSGDVRNYVEIQGFEGNTLTNDPGKYAIMQDHLKAAPDMGLGSPSVRWFSQARKECASLVVEAPAPQDTITFLGSQEAIVDPDAIHTIMGKWPNGRLIELPGAQHEVLMEEPHVLKVAWNAIDAHFGC
ncbi:MAG: alpha/beta hydrolase [Pseudomonadota bacterium]